MRYLFVSLFSLCTLTFVLCTCPGCSNPASPGNSTPDTTSHNWNFETFQLGGASSSVLSDIAIVNDSLAYAVGAIYLYDSTGAVDPYPYNVAIWNGQKLSLRRLYYKGKDYYGNDYTEVLSNITGLFAFSATNIWLADGSVFYWNGAESIAEFSFDIITPTGVLPGITKLWGNSNIDLYGVGNSGVIYHFSNNTWQKIESGTTLDFLDIYGATDSKTGVQQILAVASRNNPSGIAIFSIQNNTVAEISHYPINPDQVELYSIWFVPNKHYYVIGNGIYEKNTLSDTVWENGVFDITRDATTKIRGNALNDFFIVGSFGEFLHWNGVSWKSYINQTGLPNGGYAGVAVKGNLVIAVGANNNQAVVTIGRR